MFYQIRVNQKKSTNGRPKQYQIAFVDDLKFYTQK